MQSPQTLLARDLFDSASCQHLSDLPLPFQPPADRFASRQLFIPASQPPPPQRPCPPLSSAFASAPLATDCLRSPWSPAAPAEPLGRLMASQSDRDVDPQLACCSTTTAPSTPLADPWLSPCVHRSPGTSVASRCSSASADRCYHASSALDLLDLSPSQSPAGFGSLETAASAGDRQETAVWPQCAVIQGCEVMHADHLHPLELLEASGKLTRWAGSRPERGPPGANVFVFHLPPEWTADDLLKTFSPCGAVLSAYVFLDFASPSGGSKGFGFVAFEQPIGAARALKNMQGFRVGGKRLRVSVKRGEEGAMLGALIAQQEEGGRTTLANIRAQARQQQREAKKTPLPLAPPCPPAVPPVQNVSAPPPTPVGPVRAGQDYFPPPPPGFEPRPASYIWAPLGSDARAHVRAPPPYEAEW